MFISSTPSFVSYNIARERQNMFSFYESVGYRSMVSIEETENLTPCTTNI